VREPSVLLMDEPISHLEARQRARMREELVDLQKRLGTTTIYVTHDQIEAMTMANRIAVMNLGELQQVGTPREVYERPRTEFVGGFIGEPPMNFANCEISRQNGSFSLQSPSFNLELGAALGAKLEGYKGSKEVHLGIRPESIGVGFQPDENCVHASVYVLEPQGERSILSTRLKNGELFLIEVPPDFEAEPDTPIYLQFREPLHLFGAESGVNLFYS
jgi:multiple sugar transport system ATP-binding protein